MRSLTSRRTLKLAAFGVCLAGALVSPAIASADAPTAQQGSAAAGITVKPVYWGRGPADWNHPEWGPGWNNGYPAPGWVPPNGWAPPADWNPPRGWYPPPGYRPPPDWVGPCAGPLSALFHPVRCF